MSLRIAPLGSGIGWRREIAAEIRGAGDRIDFVELLVDQFLGEGRLEQARQVCEEIATVPHGIGLSIGSANGVDPDYLAAIKQVADLCSAPYYSEHLCTTRAPGIDIGHLSPLQFTEEVLARTIANVHQVQESLGKPLVLENVTYLFAVPGAEIEQAEFFSRVVADTGCGILLDITNAYINAENHGQTASDFIEALPLDAVVQVHLAGGYWHDGIFLDAHSELVHEPVWDLLEDLCGRTRVPACVIEHDANFPSDAEALIAQVERARAIQDMRCVE